MKDRTELVWQKASYSNGTGGACVEVADLPAGGHLVRDTKDRGNGPVLRFGGAEWAAFTEAVKNGEFE